MGETSAENLVAAIAEAQETVTLPRLIFGLGIPHVGRAVAGDLAREYQSLDALANAAQSDLGRLEGVGETMAEAIADWFRNDRNQKLLRRLRERGINPKARKRGTRLEGRTFVLTGSLESMTREEAKEAIRQQGGEATSSVSGETDYLVVGSNPGSTKTQNAEEHRTKTIDEEKLLELLGRK
jgi:DNA ligase (NAD+)